MTADALSRFVLRPHISSMYSSILEEEIVKAHLDGVRSHHQDSYEHLVRVGKLSMYLGVRNHLCDDQLRLLGYAGALHDVGKQGIPHCVLCKAGPLEPAERAVMQSHVRLGFMALADLGQNIREIVVSHHEYQIASYPRSGDDRRRRERRNRELVVPVDARATADRRDWSLERRQSDAMILNLGQMLAAADIYDALSSKRGYKEAMEPARVREIMEKEYTGPRKYVMQLFSS